MYCQKLIIVVLLELFISPYSSAETNHVFEKDECTSVNDKKTLYSDLIIKCDENEIIKKLKITKKSEKITEENYHAKGGVENLNKFMIEPVWILASFYDKKNNVIGLCSQAYRQKLNPGGKGVFSINCENYKLPSKKNSNISYVKLSISPF